MMKVETVGEVYLWLVWVGSPGWTGK